MWRVKLLWRRFHALFVRDEVESDLDKEFKFHLDMRIQEYVESGMSETEARAAARRRFGSIGLAKERSRDVRGPGFIDPLLQDLRYAARTLRHRPGFALVAILALAVGIGANTAVFSFIDAMFLRPLPLPMPDRLVRFYGHARDGGPDSFSYANYADVRDRAGSFDSLAAHQYATVNLTTNEGAQKIDAELVTGNYFRVMGVQAALGRVLQPADDRELAAHPVVVISDGLWKRQFGAQPTAIGSSVVINARRFEVVGVLPEFFKGSFPAFKADLWAPMMMHEEIRPRGLPLSHRGWGWLYGTGRLRAEVSMEQAQAEVTSIARQLQDEFPRFNSDSFDFRLLPAGAMREQYSEGAARMLMFLMLAAAAVLLITCGNIASVLLARAMSRRAEIAVRQSLGAGKARLTRQWITESILLAVLGGAGGLMLAVWIGNAALSFAPPELAAFSPDFRIDARTAGFSFAISILAGIVFGLFPALWVRRADIVAVLKHEGGATGARTSRSRMYAVLVSGQIALSVVLLIAAGLLFRSLRQSNAFDPGFNTRNLVIANVEPVRAGMSRAAAEALFPRLLEEIRTLPGVRAVTASIVVPLGPFDERSGVWIPGRQDPSGRPYFSIANATVGPEYFATMEIPVTAGRTFDDHEFRSAARPVVIVGETMAKQFWPGESAVGKTIRFAERGPDVEIVGVARDIKYYDLNERPMPYLYRPFGQAGGSPIFLVRSEADPSAVIAAMKSRLSAIERNLTWENLVTFEELRSSVLLPARAMLAAAGVFGLIALSVTAVGLYGVVSYSVSRRTAEIGIRMALGADRGEILRMILKDGLRLAVIGCACGVAIALGVTRFLTTQLFGVTATDPATYLGITLLIMVVAGIASYLPARRATRISPTLAVKWGA